MEAPLPYHCEETRTNSFGASDWYAALPSDHDYSEETQRAQEEEWQLTTKLGPLGAQRVREFQTYPSFWGDGTHRSYSPGALRRMIRFLKNFTFEKDLFPSVFFTEEGGFELAWENHSAKAIQIEFAPDRIEVFHAEKGIDEELDNTDQDKLISLLS